MAPSFLDICFKKVFVVGQDLHEWPMDPDMMVQPVVLMNMRPSKGDPNAYRAEGAPRSIGEAFK
jgi:hypothetical protein